MDKPRQHATYHAIPPTAFAALGVQQIAYVKRIDGERNYAIHAADGTPLTVMQSREAAMAAVVQNDMEPLSVH